MFSGFKFTAVLIGLVVALFSASLALNKCAEGLRVDLAQAREANADLRKFAEQTAASLQRLDTERRRLQSEFIREIDRISRNEGQCLDEELPDDLLDF